MARAVGKHYKKLNLFKKSEIHKSYNGLFTNSILVRRSFKCFLIFKDKISLF